MPLGPDGAAEAQVVGGTIQPDAPWAPQQMRSRMRLVHSRRNMPTPVSGVFVADSVSVINIDAAMFGRFIDVATAGTESRPPLELMIEGYEERAEEDLEMAEADLEATLDILPDY